MCMDKCGMGMCMDKHPYSHPSVMHGADDMLSLNLQAFISRMGLLHPDIPAVRLLMKQVAGVDGNSVDALARS